MRGGMRHIPLIIRQVRRSSKQAVLFVLCVALSLTTLTAFNGFATAVGRSLLNDARTLHAADIIIKSYDPISTPLDQAVERLVAGKQVLRANIHEFFSVVRALDESASVLAGIKVVGKGYPFYGRVGLASGRSFHEVLSTGNCIVEQTLLDRTGIKVGDRLKVGYTLLTIADVVTSEPDRPLNFFSFGPRVFVHADDLEALGLVAKGGRIRRGVLLKVLAPERLNAIATQLKQAALTDQEQVDTFETAGSRIKRFIDNFFFFLKLVGLFILLMAGLGIQGTLAALLKEKQNTIAIMKTIGATNGFIVRHFMSMVGLLGAAGTAIGIVSGIGVQMVLGRVMAPFLPAHIGLDVSWSGVLEGVLVGFLVVLIFSFLPLYRIKEMRPMMIFKRQPIALLKKGPYYLAGTLTLIFFFALVLRHMHDVRFGLYFVGGLTALILVAALLAQLMLWVAGRRAVQNLVLRQAIRGLFRKGNATRSIIITLAASLSLIFANYLIEKNLDAAFVQSYPKEAPNAYFVDIQPEQKEAFVNMVGRQSELYPIVRARVTAINGEAVNRQQERQKRRDNFSRVFNLTYRRHLLEDETLIKGKQLFKEDGPDLQVSVLDTVVQMHPMTVGDTLSFKIQGVPLKARISSIRTRNRSSFSPFFYFVFPETVLKQAPQTYFAALKVPPEQLGALQRRIVSQFPNISVIDISQTIRVFTRLMTQLSGIIRTFSLFSIAAGLLILISAIYATRAERVIEAVYYKILGAGKPFVFKVFSIENLLIGLFSALPALILAQAGAYWVCTVKLEIGYRAWVIPSVLLVAVTLLLVLVVGLTASRSIMEKRPVVYLREQVDG
jgi:putative ABC transport system permease protein